MMIFEGKVNVTINFVPEDIFFLKFESIKITKSINPNDVKVLSINYASV